MQSKTREVGGGPAVGLANDFVSLLQSILGGNAQVGGGGTSPMARVDQSNPMGRTAGIAGVLNDIIAGGAGNFGGSLAKLISQQQTRDVGDLRARFGASGGAAFGTPAASAEALYRASAAPQAATAIGGLQLQTLLPLLQLAAGLSEKGISQRGTIVQPSDFTSILSSLAPAAGAIAPFLAKNPLSGAGLSGVDTSGFDPSQLWNIPLPAIGR